MRHRRRIDLRILRERKIWNGILVHRMSVSVSFSSGTAGQRGQMNERTKHARYLQKTRLT